MHLSIDVHNALLGILHPSIEIPNDAHVPNMLWKVISTSNILHLPLSLCSWMNLLFPLYVGKEQMLSINLMEKYHPRVEFMILSSDNVLSSVWWINLRFIFICLAHSKWNWMNMQIHVVTYKTVETPSEPEKSKGSTRIRCL